MQRILRVKFSENVSQKAVFADLLKEIGDVFSE